ncbi:hypothetical protein IFM89_002391 [Coptis chinensis]|uniref:F-box domain-containing protein n=1 Tax=Coptis chinensis TaxID=261450 RepID=A0A835IJ29_9MAGN|nr:hypothetical protein IFM89_002391 [Coptis chinensis]
MAKTRQGRAIDNHVQKRARRRTEQEVCESKKMKRKAHDLPTEIFYDILSRLPLTFLLGSAKSTCKLWRSIITDPMFSQLQMPQALTNPGNLYSSLGDSNLYFAYKPLGDKIVAMKLPGELGGNKYKNLVSSGGLMCYHDIEEKSIYICNPIIGDHVKINSQYFEREGSFGFGYAPLSKKYKYLQVIFEKQPKPRITVAILTLGEESWRVLADHQNPIINQFPVYCNGALYWLGPNLFIDEDTEYQVVSFDVETEKFRRRRILPKGTSRNFQSCDRHLAVLGETVAFVTANWQGCFQEIWTLIDEAEDIWVQPPRISKPGKACYRFMGLWMNQDLYGMEIAPVVLRNRQTKRKVDRHKFRKRWLVYNPDNEKHTAIQFPFVTDDPHRVIAHVGSLVSPSKIVAAAAKQPSFATSG